MTHYFLDSSALIKRYIRETGTEWVRSLSVPGAGNAILIAQISQVEVISGTFRRHREGFIAARTAQAVRLLLDRHASREYHVVRLTEEIVRRAEDALTAYPLRAYDAVRLASALVSNAHLIANGLAPLIFVSADTRLLAVAGSAGLPADDPNTHP